MVSQFVPMSARAWARPTVFAWAAAAASLAGAQTPTSTALAPVVVSASRVPQPATDVMADVSLIDRAELDRAGQSTLHDVLALQPGVQVGSNGGYRSSTSVFLRGANSAQAIVMIDGVRVGSATFGGAPFENLPLDRIDRIEILRGAASALYGPDAVGGVIQIFTRDPAPTLQLTANVGAGSDGQRQAGASVRGRLGAVGYSLGVSQQKADGISVVKNPASGSYNPDADGFDVTGVDAKLRADVSREHALTLALLHSRMDYQFDGTAFPDPLGLTNLTTDAWARTTLKAASLKWEAQWLPHWKSTVTLGRSDDQSVSDYYRLTDGAFDTSDRFNTQRDQLSWQNDITLGADVLTVLLERRTESVDSSTAYTVTQRDIHSIMAAYALNRANWNALAVLRSDDNSQFGRFNNWALSGGYKLSPAWRAVASLGTSFSAPSFNQLYYPGFGNATLTPQQNRASEVGLKYQQGAVSASATLYHNDIQGLIDPATNAQSSQAVLRGITLAMQAQHGDTHYSVSYDYADPRSQPSDARLVRVAQNVLNLGVSQRIGAVQAFGELKLSSDREDNNLSFTGRDVLPGYALLNLGAAWKLRPDLTLQARINNLADTQYALANGYSTPGRNLFVGLAWAR